MDFILRVIADRETLVDSQFATLDKAIVEAKSSVEGRLVDAKTAADGVNTGIMKRVEVLESGGAPFASRLDESLADLKTDVGVLKENMVRTTVLDALREQNVADSKIQKRQIKLLGITVAVSIAIAVCTILVQIFHSSTSKSSVPAWVARNV